MVEFLQAEHIACLERHERWDANAIQNMIPCFLDDMRTSAGEQLRVSKRFYPALLRCAAESVAGRFRDSREQNKLVLETLERVEQEREQAHEQIRACQDRDASLRSELQAINDKPQRQLLARNRTPHKVLTLVEVMPLN
eukprot:s4482_g1.t1